MLPCQSVASLLIINIQAFQPEWHISAMIYSQDTPFWSENIYNTITCNLWNRKIKNRRTAMFFPWITFISFRICSKNFVHRLETKLLNWTIKNLKKQMTQQSISAILKTYLKFPFLHSQPSYSVHNFVPQWTWMNVMVIRNGTKLLYFMTTIPMSSLKQMTTRVH